MDAFTLEKVEFDTVRRIVAEFCRCSLGKSLAARIAPSRRPETVTLWLNQTSQMIDAVRDFGPPPFGGITDISEQMFRVCEGNQASGEDFARIASTLEGAANVRAYLTALPDHLTLLHDLREQLLAFDGEIKAIRTVVGPDGEVLDEASPRLGEFRRKIESVTYRIHDVIHSYLRDPDVARLLQNTTVTLHADRFVLPVRSDNRGRLPGVVHRTSGSGATVFVEPNASVELNNELADLRDDERREVQRLLDELSLRVAARAGQIDQTIRMLAQVDLLAAKAQYAYQFDMTAPDIAERGPLEFHQARHPLLIDQARRQEQRGQPPENRLNVVPIDVRLGSDFDLLVITGSNTGGKTVTLKTVALLVMMAQSGLHIPVRRGAVMPVFRNVFIDIGDEQSLEQSLSTYGAHITRIRHILSQADRATLVLLDELGSGTDPDEGGAIGQAILDELRQLGCVAMVTTHLSVLKAYAMNTPRVDNASVAFDVQTLRPTYHLRIGTAGESHAIDVAQRLGMPKRLTAAARGHLDHRSRQLTRALRATGAARQTAESARAEAASAKLAAQVETEQLQSERTRLQQLHQDFERWLGELVELRPGDSIAVPTLAKAGRLVRLELHRQIAVVDADNVQIEVPLRELMPDFGQLGPRQEIASLRHEITTRAAESRTAADKAKELQKQYQRELHQLKRRGEHFDAWLRAIHAMTVGQNVPISRPPGSGTLTAVDLVNLRATVQTPRGPLQLRLQELFPPETPKDSRKRETRRGKSRPSKNKPRTRNEKLHHRSPDSKAARTAREAVLAMAPGEAVYVVPFKTRATLVRLQPDKDSAVVQNGAFEMTVAIVDLDVVRNTTSDRPPPSPDKQ